MAEFLVDGVLVDSWGKPVESAASEPETTDYTAMNSKDFLAAVENGDLSKEEAIKLEEARTEPRKGVLEALRKEE